MTRLIKIVLAPVLVLAMVGSTVYLGVTRSGAMQGLVEELTEADSIRSTLASAFVDTIIDEEAGLIGVLIKKNREQVEATVAETLAQPEQREQLGQSAQQWMDAMLAGEAVVEVDSRPLFRPIYIAIGEILPILEFTEADIAELEPIILGADEPLPDLRIVRNAARSGALLWLLWFALAVVLLRRVGVSATRTIGWQLLSIGTFGLAIILTTPGLLASLAGDATSRSLARTALSALSGPGVWLSGIVMITGLALLNYHRRRRVGSGEGILAGEGTADTQ